MSYLYSPELNHQQDYATKLTLWSWGDNIIPDDSEQKEEMNPTNIYMYE